MTSSNKVDIWVTWYWPWHNCMCSFPLFNSPWSMTGVDRPFWVWSQCYTLPCDSLHYNKVIKTITSFFLVVVRFRMTWRRWFWVSVEPISSRRFFYSFGYLITVVTSYEYISFVGRNFVKIPHLLSTVRPNLSVIYFEWLNCRSYDSNRVCTWRNLLNMFWNGFVTGYIVRLYA